MGCLITNARHVYEVIFTKLSILFMRVSMILLARTTGKLSAESFFFLVFWFNPFHVSVYFI